MPTNRTLQENELLFQQATKKKEDAAPGSLRSPGQLPSPVHRGEQHQPGQHMLNVYLTLLVILCLAALGSLSLAPHLLPSAFLHNQPLSPLPVASGAPVSGGACTAAPSDLHYLPPASTSTQNDSQVWSQAGYTKQDLASASACAASFVITYLSFDATQAQTFVACATLLSAGGQQRFSGHASNRPADLHEDPLWQASMQKQQVRQSAQTSPPVLLMAAFEQERMLAWMQVNYQLTIHRGAEAFTLTDAMTVLVISFPRNAPHKGSGWQVSDWRSGNEAFPPASPL